VQTKHSAALTFNKPSF